MNSKEKEALLSEFYPDINPLVIEPEDFLLIKENGIFDAKVLRNLQNTIEKMLGNGCFALVNNDQQINAKAMIKNDIPIITVHTGTIIKLLYSANLMMLSDSFLPAIGNTDACYSDLHSDEYPMMVEGVDSILVKMFISGDPRREMVGYMIACLAVYFVIYHEVGHHKKGHIFKLKKEYNLAFNDAVNGNEDMMDCDFRKKIEFEADSYAMVSIVDSIDGLIEKWKRYFGESLSYSEIFQLMIPALVLVKENLPVDVYLPEEIEKSYYLPNMIRVTLSAFIMFFNPKIRPVLYHDITLVFQEDKEFRNKFEHDNQVCVFDEDGLLTDKAFGMYLSLMIVHTEQIYCDIFIGAGYVDAFYPDVKAMEWYLELK